ncbi:MAG: DUF2169 domain-containing protein [Deltaproteobacteria bacterium]|nr:DUF2169 domain-containing protein [Deltaproteobacteria bacterium]
MQAGNYEIERFTLADPEGNQAGVVVAKATYVLGDDRILVPAEDKEPVRFAALPIEGDDPAASPIMFDSDSVLAKAMTDVVVHGTAYAPKGRPVPSFDVEVTVGKARRVLRVFGPRHASWRKPSRQTKKETIFRTPVFSEPEPVASVPLNFTRAYGGTARYELPGGEDVIEIPCPSNPLGMGYCVQNSRAGLDGLELPQIEDPGALLTPESVVRRIGAPEDLPLPVGFGVYAAAWYPRVAFAGVMPFQIDEARERIREQAADLDPEKDAEAIAMLEGFEPPVMDPRFHQSAAPGMTFPILAGDEALAFRNMTPGGMLTFNLPGVRPLLRLETGAGRLTLPTVLDTVVFLVDDMKLVLTFRGKCVLSQLNEGDEFSALPMEVEDIDVRAYEKVLVEEGIG